MTDSLLSLLQASQPLLHGVAGRGLSLLFEATLKGTFFLLAAIALALALRCASAATRHLIWTLALVAMLALPFLALTVPAWKFPVISSSGKTADEQTMTVKGAVRNHRLYRKYRAWWLASVDSGTPSHEAWVGWIMVLWGIGATLWTARITLGEVRVRGLAGRSQLLQTSQMKSTAENVCLRLRISRVVAVRSSAETPVPFTRGVFRASVFLPAEAHQWSRTQLEFVLAHELAHLNRHDYLTQMLAQVACALFWFHPLVWLAAFEMRKEREQACDDVVLSLGHRATDYAEFLFALGRSLCGAGGLWSPSVGMAQFSQLEVRMKA